MAKLNTKLNDGSVNEIHINGTSDSDKVVTQNEVRDYAFTPLIQGMITGDVIDLDCANKNFFDIYLNRDITRINLPINAINGETYRVQIRQDGTGGRFVRWGNKDIFKYLEVSIYQSGGEIELYIEDGTFNWSVLRADAGRKSFINLDGFNYENNNIAGLKVKSFDESSNLVIHLIGKFTMMKM